MKNTIIFLSTLITGILAQADFASEDLATGTAKAVELSRKEINTKIDSHFLGHTEKTELARYCVGNR